MKYMMTLLLPLLLSGCRDFLEDDVYTTPEGIGYSPLSWMDRAQMEEQIDFIWNAFDEEVGFTEQMGLEERIIVSPAVQKMVIFCLNNPLTMRFLHNIIGAWIYTLHPICILITRT
jgi:hypothetical protein